MFSEDQNGEKDPNRDDIPTALLRQRRNLILLSLILLLLYYSGAAIQSTTLSIFGFELTLSNPKVFDDFIVIWIAWAYFLWRYTQYLSFYRVSSDIKSEYTQQKEPLYNRYFFEKLKSKHPQYFKHTTSLLPSNVEFRLRKGFRFKGAGNVDGVYKVDAYTSNLNFFIALYCSVRALLLSLIISRHVSDYWFPYIIALSPAAYFYLA